MLAVNSVSKFFADQLILKDISFVVNAGERVGLIGPNGSGKTTLLRIIADEELPERGSVFIDPRTRVGYLRQGLDYPIGCTLADALHDPRVDTAQDIERLAMASSFDPARLAEYQAALDRLEAQGGYPDQSLRDTVLKNLGLDRVPLSLPVAVLSGGQKTRLGLAKVLLSAPNLLLLDEPTNHLDLPMLEWLEKWLSNFKGAVLLVSHDRVFLDRVDQLACCISIHRRTRCAATRAITRLIWSRVWPSTNSTGRRINSRKPRSGVCGRTSRGRLSRRGRWSAVRRRASRMCGAWRRRWRIRRSRARRNSIGIWNPTSAWRSRSRAGR